MVCVLCACGMPAEKRCEACDIGLCDEHYEAYRGFCGEPHCLAIKEDKETNDGD